MQGVLVSENYRLLPLVAGLGAFAVSVVLVPLVRHFARQLNAVDVPGHGKMHGRATPYFGGVAIALAAVAVPLLLRGWTAEGAYVLIGALLVGLVGLVDDLRTVHPYLRLVLELVAASIAVAGGARIDVFPDWIDWVVSIVLIVIVTNSFNLLDNMDGVAGAIAVASSGALLIAALLEHQALVGALAASVLGGVLGFLVYNWHPASIFMGDAGSLFIGFLISVTALKLRTSAPPVESALSVGFILAVPLFDTGLVIVSRVHAKRSVFQGGKDHTSHRLNQLGLPIRWVAASLAFITFVAAGSGVAIARNGVDPGPACLVLLVVVLGSLVPLLRVRVYAHAHASRADSRRDVK